MATYHPYLNFNGNTEEAFNFYRSVIGGEFSDVMRYKDVPGGGGQTESDGDKIMHIGLPLGNGIYLMGTDITGNMPPVTFGSNISICIVPENRDEAYKFFNGLSEGGTIMVPFEKMFWGDYFGQFMDKFGVQWMVNFNDKEEKKD